MNLKLRNIFLVLLLTLLFIGISYATEVESDDTTTDTSISHTDEIVQSTSTPLKSENNLIEKTNTKKEIKKENNKTQKTETSKTYDVNDYNTLENILKKDTTENITININSDIKLKNSINVNENIYLLTINGNGKTIDGNNKYSFLNTTHSNTIDIKNIKVMNCYSETDGGAIYNDIGRLTIINSTISNNRAKNTGGAIYTYSGTLKIINSTLNNNQAEYQGGAIYSIYTRTMITNTTLNNNKITNDSSSWTGGAIHNQGTMTITNSILNNSHADSGGAIYNFVFLTISNCTITNTTSSFTGAIENRGKLNITDSVFSYNKMGETYRYGAAVTNYGNLKINNSNFNNNRAYEGGAIYNSANATLMNCTFNNNTAQGYYSLGGAIYNSGSSTSPGNLTINNCTFTNHTAYIGGAIFNEYNPLTVTNSIFINNSSPLNLNDNYYTGGGAITIRLSNNIEIINNEFINNTACNGAAIRVHDFEDYINIMNERQLYGTNTTIKGNVFINNKANMTGNTIIDEGNNSLIKNNIFDTSEYSSTIHIYNSTNTTVINNTFTDYKRATILTVGSREKVEVGTQMSIYGKLTDKNGKDLAFQEVTISLDNKNYTTTTTQYGNYKIQITPTIGGTKTIKATYKGTNTYRSSSATSMFIANKNNTILTVGSRENVLAGTKMSIYGKLTDKNSKDLAYQQIQITLDGNTYTTTTTQYGNYKIQITPLTSGSKTITSIYGGSNVYNGASASSTFIVNKQDTILTVGSRENVLAGTKMSIYGKLTDKNSKDLAYQQIQITVDSNTYTTTTTQYGNYKIQITPKTPGNKSITATYKGTNIYNKATATSTFITQQDSILTVGSSKTVLVGNKMSIYGKLTDKNGKDLAYQEIQITIDGNTYSTTTTQYGNYKIQFTSQTQGSKTITATYKGTNIYNNATASSTFKANKKNSTITVGSTKTIKRDTTMSIYGKLSTNGVNIPYQQVTITIDGKTYQQTTNQYGNYNFKITPTTLGNKTIVATYSGTNIYVNSRATSTFKVIKA